MTYRNPPLLAERPENSHGKTSVLPHHPSHKRTHQETISRDIQGEPLHAEITTPLTTIPDDIPQGKGLLINQ